MEAEEPKHSESPEPILDENLERLHNKNLFPEQLKRVNEILAEGGLPKGWRVSSELDGKYDDQPFFKEKTKKAMELIERAGLPDMSKSK